jgi:predicted phosphodiesterase
MCAPSADDSRKTLEQTMRIQPLADLHVEMSPCDIPVLGDVIVLAGDTHVGVESVRWAKGRFDGKPTIMVAGNHEFYGQTFPETIAELRAEAAGSSIHVLENDEVVLDGVRFLGATLWTDFCLQGFARQEIAMAGAKHGLNDFRRIYKASGDLLRPQDVASVHAETVAWLRRKLAEPFTGKTVVVTHHAACVMSVHPQMRFDGLTAAFASNLENLILDHEPDLWISGHTHYCCDYHIGKTRMVSNQRGYSDLESTGFDASLAVDP